MGNKWTEHVKTWATKNNMNYTTALKCKECKDEYIKINPESSKSTKQRNKKKLQNIPNESNEPKTLEMPTEGTGVIEYGKAIMFGRNDFQPKMRKILRIYGKVPILKMYACRTPVGSLLLSLLNVISLGEFYKKWSNTPYDKLFHLDLRVELDTKPQVTILLEKNEVINSVVNPPPPGKDTDVMPIPINKQYTILDLLTGAKQVLGNKFFTYSAKDNNCQDFIMALLKGSNIGTQDAFTFIKQDTKQLFEGLTTTRKLANTVTDIGGRANVIVQGASIHKSENYYIQSVVFDKSMFDVKQAKDWLKKNNYVIKKEDITDTQIRFRQVNPDYIKEKGFDSFKTKKIGKKSGISLIIAYNKPIKGKKVDMSCNCMKGKGIGASAPEEPVDIPMENWTQGTINEWIRIHRELFYYITLEHKSTQEKIDEITEYKQEFQNILNNYRETNPNLSDAANQLIELCDAHIESLETEERHRRERNTPMQQAVYPRARAQLIQTGRIIPNNENDDENLPIAEDVTGRGLLIGYGIYPIYKSQMNGGKLSSTKINKAFTKGIEKATTAVNPMSYAIKNKQTQQAMIDTGTVTTDYLLPGVVSAGLPLYYGAAGTAGMMLGGPIGAAAAVEGSKKLYEGMVTSKGYDPRESQKSSVLGAASENVGKYGASELKSSAKPTPTNKSKGISGVRGLGITNDSKKPKPPKPLIEVILALPDDILREILGNLGWEERLNVERTLLNILNGPNGLSADELTNVSSRLAIVREFIYSRSRSPPPMQESDKPPSPPRKKKKSE